MKSLLLLLLTFSTIGLSAQTNPQNKLDKNQILLFIIFEIVSKP
jgi:uncharacterized protein YhhL (DUF1145 family)